MIPPPVKAALPEVARVASGTPPLDLLRTTVSLLGASLGFRPSLDLDHDELRAEALQVCAVVPTLLCALHRLQHGEQPIDPDPSLPYTANYLSMMLGEVPTPEHALAVEQYLISTIDHGFNASTFTARVITSTGADLAAAVVGAIGALSGPLHGGAPSRALQMLDEIGTIDNADPWIRAAVERGDRLMGFGHRVYKVDDPRSVMLRSVAERLGGPKLELRRASRAARGRDPRRAEAGPEAVHERRVLRRDRHGRLRRASRHVHPDVRVESRHRVERPRARAGGRQPAHPPERPLRRASPAAAGPARRLSRPARRRPAAVTPAWRRRETPTPRTAGP